jgi:hypothetical protein
MDFKISNKVISPTGKRIDCRVKVSGFFADPYEIQLRLLSREVVNENRVEDLIDQVIERKKDWKQGKKNLSLSLNGINANAYIIKINNNEDNS